MKRSPLYPETTTDSVSTGRLAQVGQAFRGLLAKAGERTPQPSHGPVSAQALAIGRVIGEHADLSRLSSAHFKTRPADVGTNRPSDERITREFLHTERHDTELRPSPETIFTIAGSGYHRYPSGPDSFIARFGSFTLSSGDQLVQCVPYEFEGPSYGHEYDAAKTTLAELFPGADVAQLERHARVNIGTMGPDGAIIPIRDFNPRPFGCNFGAILHQGRQLASEGTLDLYVSDGQVKEF